MNRYIKLYILLFVCTCFIIFISSNVIDNSEIRYNYYQTVVILKQKNIKSVNDLIKESMKDDIITNAEFAKIYKEYSNITISKNKNELIN